MLAHAVGVLGRARGSDTDLLDLPWPAPPPWREVPAVPIENGGPTFARHFEFRPLGAAPFSGAASDVDGDDSLVASGWVRPRDPGPARDAAYVASLADAWWPAILGRFTAPRPVATVAYTLEILDGTLGLDPDAPFFHTARCVACRAGYLVEMRQLWGEDGRLLALNQQTIAIIK